MTKSMPCPRCAVTREFELIEREESITIKARDVFFLAHFSRCTTCGDEYEAPGQLDANLDAIREAYGSDPGGCLGNQD